MSVDYESVLIYGIKCNPSAWGYEEMEYMENKEWDVIYDNYSNNFLYIGKILSHARLGEEIQYQIPDAELIDLTDIGCDIIEDIPDNIFYNAFLDGGAIPKLYHICYAT
jgi:hypothetical protein